MNVIQWQCFNFEFKISVFIWKYGCFLKLIIFSCELVRALETVFRKFDKLYCYLINISACNELFLLTFIIASMCFDKLKFSFPIEREWWKSVKLIKHYEVINIRHLFHFKIQKNSYGRPHLVGKYSLPTTT